MNINFLSSFCDGLLGHRVPTKWIKRQNRSRQNGSSAKIGQNGSRQFKLFFYIIFILVSAKIVFPDPKTGFWI